MSDSSFHRGRELERGVNSITSIGKKHQNNSSETNLFTHLPIHLFTSKKSAFTLAEGATHVAHCKDLRKVAFTLAEVLITIGVIGVVAALTLPTLIQNYKKQVVATRLEKFYSTINQAIKMSELTYGEREQWFVDSSDFEKNKQWFDKYIAPNMNIIKQETRNVWSENWKFYFFADGSAVGIFGTNMRDYKYFPMSLDKCLKSATWNAPVEGRCVFSFYYNPTRERYNFEPFDHALEQETDKEYALKYHKNYGCYHESYNSTRWPAYCTKMVQYNGWKFPKDYPWKLY